MAAKEPVKVYKLSAFGHVPSISADHTRIIAAALASGEAEIVLPPGRLNVESPLMLTVDGQCLRGSGPSTVLYNARPAGSPAEPMLISPPGMSSTVIADLALRARGMSMKQPGTRDLSSIYDGSAVVICSNQARCSRLSIADAWDNGLAVVSVVTGKGVFGAPADFMGEAIRTFNCGCGDHAAGGPGRIGSGINILSGTNFQLSDCIDRGSNGAQTVDDGGGASGRILSCSGFENPLNGDGTGACFYTGSPDVEFVGCQAYFPRGYGFWLAGGSQVIGGSVWGAEKGGVLITRNHITVSSLRLKDICSKPGQAGSSEACIVIDSTLETLNNILITNTTSFSTQSVLPRYGVHEQGGGNHTIGAVISNCDLHGALINYDVGAGTKVLNSN